MNKHFVNKQQGNMKQKQIQDYFTKKRKNVNNENNQKRDCGSQQRTSEDSSDLFYNSSDLSLNSSAMANESLDGIFNNSRKSEGKEIDTIGQTNAYTDPDVVIVCDVNPNIVNEIQFELPQPKEKKRNKIRVRKVNKSLAKNSTLFIFHTIDQYDKHLKTSETFKGILTDESLALLSALALESEDNKMLVSYLFSVDQFNPTGIAEKNFPGDQKYNYDCKALHERGFITFNPEARVLTVKECINRLTVPQIQEACENFITTNYYQTKMTTHQKKKMKKEIITKCSSRDIREFYPDSGLTGDNKTEAAERLRTKAKQWKLSDLARETIAELIVLMHLDNIFKMGCSIDYTQLYNGRPVLKYKPSGNTKPYPVDKEMILDNAKIIFQNREEFCAYLNALALFEEYNTAKDKLEFVSRIYQLYKDANGEDLSRYRALPLWLRRFTPINVYVDILTDGVTHLKKSKKYNRVLEILDLLITQVTFRQDTKAEWYATKTFIQLKNMKSPENAAHTLCEAFNAGLPEETIMKLRHRAKQILEGKTRSQIDQKVIDVLQVQAESEILERSIPDAYYHFQDPVGKLNSRRRPQYQWNSKLVLAETLCCNIYKEKQSFTLVEHWEGNLMNAIFFMLFWDIIYTKPLAIGGIFLSHYQQYPLDMWCENFYINRKAIIDDFLTMIQKSNVDNIMKMIKDRYDTLVQYDVPEMSRNMINLKNIETVVYCLGPRALAAICRRLAHNYNYMRLGFPDLTLCNTENCTIEFREVKTNDPVQPNQMQWLRYLNEHNIKAGFCYVRNKKEQDTEQEAANKSSIDISNLPGTNNDEPQPGPSTSLA